MKMSHDLKQFLSGSSVDAGIDALAVAIFENQLACWRSEEYWAAINQVAGVASEEPKQFRISRVIRPQNAERAQVSQVIDSYEDSGLRTDLYRPTFGFFLVRCRACLLRLMVNHSGLCFVVTSTVASCSPPCSI